MEEAHRILEWAKRGKAKDLSEAGVFTGVFEACSVAGDGSGAFKAHHKMEQMELAPTLTQMELLVEAVGKDPSSTMEQMKQLQQLCRAWRGGRKCFGMSLMRAYGRMSARFDTVEAALQVLSRMKVKKTLDLAALTQIMSFYAENGESVEQMLKICNGAVERFGLSVDGQLYVTMMKNFAAVPHKRRHVFDMFRQMQETGMKIDRHVVTLVLRTAMEARKFGVAAQIVAHLRDNMQSVDWDLALLNQLMQVASHCKDAPALVRQVMEEMKVRDIPLNVQTYNLQISLHGRLGEIDRAFELYEEMKTRSVEPTDATFTALFTACRASKDAERAWGLVLAMEQQGRRLDNHIHGSLLEAVFVRAGRYELERRWRRKVRSWKAAQGPDYVPDSPVAYATSRAPPVPKRLPMWKKQRSASGGRAVGAGKDTTIKRHQ